MGQDRTRIQALSSIVSDDPTGQMLLEMEREEKTFLFPLKMCYLHVRNPNISDNISLGTQVSHW